MLSVYPAIFFKEESGYSVIFPDLNYLSTCGETIDEAFTMALDCLAGHLFWLSKEGETFPTPSELTDIIPANVANELDFDYVAEKTFTNMISVDVAQYAKTHFEKSVKKTLTIPAWLNKAAIEQNINFSQVLQNALVDILNIPPKTAVTSKKGV